MKKSILGLLILVAVGAGISLYFRPEKELIQSSVNNQPTGNFSENLPPAGGTNADGKDDLKEEAMKIISRPVKISAPLSEASRKQAEDKIEEMNNLIRADYDYIYPWYDLGAYRRLIGDYDGAIEAYSFLIKIRPKDSVAYENLGDMYRSYLKNYEKAEQNFLASINISSSNINAYLQLADVYEFGLKEKSEQAEELLILGIKSNPDVPILRIALGQYYERLGRNSDALKYFEEALRLDSANESLKKDIERLKSG